MDDNFFKGDSKTEECIISVSAAKSLVFWCF